VLLLTSCLRGNATLVILPTVIGVVRIMSVTCVWEGPGLCLCLMLWRPHVSHVPSTGVWIVRIRPTAMHALMPILSTQAFATPATFPTVNPALLTTTVSSAGLPQEDSYSTQALIIPNASAVTSQTVSAAHQTTTALSVKVHTPWTKASVKCVTLPTATSASQQTYVRRAQVQTVSISSPTAWKTHVFRAIWPNVPLVSMSYHALYASPALLSFKVNVTPVTLTTASPARLITSVLSVRILQESHCTPALQKPPVLHAIFQTVPHAHRMTTAPYVPLPTNSTKANATPVTYPTVCLAMVIISVPTVQVHQA
jgi:hypothetical protein